jgi:ribA/ribD-fused uncharacterized protein
MITPIHKEQNTQLNFTLTPPIVAVQQQQKSMDTLRLTQRAQDGFSFSSLWEGVVKCFKSLFCCFFLFTDVASASTQQISRLATRDQFIWFYKAEENALTAFLGNFHPSTIRLWGMQFQCAEGAFQAAKFGQNLGIMQRFQNLNGEAAWRLGRELSRNWTPAQRNAWQYNNLQVMRHVVSAKFTQNPDLRNLLLATGSAYLIEHVPVRGRDAFWGDNFDGTGQNWLGRIAMEVRGSLGGTGVVPRNQQYNQFISRQ